jgi:hypothetical protein
VPAAGAPGPAASTRAGPSGVGTSDRGHAADTVDVRERLARVPARDLLEARDLLAAVDTG